MGYLGKQPSAVPLSGSDIVDDSIESADIKAGTIVDSDISGSAAIGAGKLAGTLDLSSKTVTLPAVSVTAHVTQTDLTPVRQDIAMLALYSASADNKAAYNLPNAFIDQFEDSTGLTTLTDVNRNTTGEYVSSISVGHGGTYSGIWTSTTIQCLNYSGSSNYVFTGDLTVEWWMKTTAYTNLGIIGTTNEVAWTSDAWWLKYDGSNLYIGIGTTSTSYTHTFASSSHDDAWHHMAFVRDSGTFRSYRDGVASPVSSANTTTIGNASFPLALGNKTTGTTMGFNGLMDNWRLSNSCRYPSGTTFSVPIADYSNDANTMLLQDFERADFSGVTGSGGSSVSLLANVGSVSRGTTVIVGTTVGATGTLISDQQTAPALTKMSGVVLVKDGGSSATVMGTHLKIYFCATGAAASFPSAWVEAASYTAVTAPFSTGVTMYKLGETTVPSGTLPTIRAVWASQTLGGYESQLHGWAMNY